MSTSLSPLLPARGDVSGVNVAQQALTEDFISPTPKYFTRYMRPSGIRADSFNVLGVISAALVFIIILSWFELMRLIIQSFFIRTKIVIDQMISYFIYVAVGTFFALLLLFLCYKLNN